MLEFRSAEERVFSELRRDVKIACEGESGGVSACLAWKNRSKSIEKDFSIKNLGNFIYHDQSWTVFLREFLWLPEERKVV